MINPYENLAKAIIILAVKDYRTALKTLSLNPHNSEAIKEKQSIERFFRSDWFCVLTKLDGEKLIQDLQCEVRKLEVAG